MDARLIALIKIHVAPRNPNGLSKRANSTAETVVIYTITNSDSAIYPSLDFESVLLTGFNQNIVDKMDGNEKLL